MGAVNYILFYDLERRRALIEPPNRSPTLQQGPTNLFHLCVSTYLTPQNLSGPQGRILWGGLREKLVKMRGEVQSERAARIAPRPAILQHVPQPTIKKTQTRISNACTACKVPRQSFGRMIKKSR